MCDHAHAAPAAQLVDVSKMDRRDLLRGLATGALVLVAGCATNPETGRSQLILIDESQLQQASLQAWSEMRQQTPQWRNAAAQRRLEAVGRRVVNAAGRGNQSWEFVLFDSDQKNAFVLPGGQVGFYRGLYEICDVDDYMATVLGHEVGHVTGRHAAERYSREAATQTALQVAGTQINSQLAMAALGLGAQVGLSLPFSREQEAEADILGINYMHAAGYDVRQAIPFWQRMGSGGGSRPPEFLSTHPDPDNRIARIRAYITQQGWG
ncbi:MAG: M48 family metallopeptidase [Hyphomonadaceae bacterium]|nr:M48 family metallopeptidase [Hyphomonadaceae bacterium]MBX3510668.1 M48 family metallopeptidase [Hyphomonadaceae bacterium]